MQISSRRGLLWMCFAAVAIRASSQTNLPVYTDQLVNGFQDWGWAARNYANASPVHSGSSSVSVTMAAWQGLQIFHTVLDVSPYQSLGFWVNGGASGGQKLLIYGMVYLGTTQNVGQVSYSLPALPTNTWQQFVVPLSAIGVSNKASFTGFVLQDRSGSSQPTFYLDDIELVAKPVPATVDISVNAAQIVRTVDQRHAGVNIAVWDGFFGSPDDTTTISLLREMGVLTLRLPGGSLSDEYHWASNTSLTNTWQWATSFSDMVHVATNIGAQAIITANYGTGTPQEAAGWVLNANVTNQLGYKYWEIGNECYGTWETDSNQFPHDAYTYAVRASNYMTLMRTADPGIRIGVVSAPREDSYQNGYASHPAINPRTGQTNYGWTPVLLTTLKSQGTAPDFLVHHVYPEWTDKNNPAASPDNDTLLLLSTGNWAVDAADLRQQITDYFGSGGTNIELVCTENNSDSGAQGTQSTSLVNGLYYADSLGRLLNTEFNGFVWWDFRNGTDTTGYFGPTVYGWRMYGDLGVVNGLNTRHPVFYAAKLMQWFARPGDRIISATSDYGWLTAYAARRSNGSVSLLVLNKSLLTNLSAQVTLNGFTPSASTVVRSFGIPQDEAARTNGPAQAQDIATNVISSAAPAFNYTFSPLSLTLFTLAPSAPRLVILPSAASSSFVFELQGQNDVPYVIQSSTNLTDWLAESTNTLVGTTMNVTNATTSDANRFWRAVWYP